jgi:hypothetical protein
MGIWLHIIRAQMAFAEVDYARAETECEIALRGINPQNTTSLGSSEAEVKGLLGLTLIHLGNPREV